MLPGIQTNKYGDMLKEFYHGLKDGTLSEIRLDDIQIKFNELWDIIQKRDTLRRLDRPEIYQPTFTSPPLRVFHTVLSTDTPVANNTLTEVTFENSWGDNSIFDFFSGSKNKISIDRSKFNVSIDGIIKWEGNSTGFRTLNLHIYQADGTSIATQEISVVAAVSVEPTTVSFAYTEDIRAIFPNVGYMTMEVLQNSGGDLDIINFVMSVKIS